MGVGLGRVAEREAGPRRDLLGQHAGRAGAGEQRLEERPRLGAASERQIRLHEPTGAQVEAALGAGQPVVGAVAIDRSVFVQAALDGCHRRGPARIVGRQEAGETDGQRGGIQVVSVVRSAEGAELGLPALFQHIGGDAIAQLAPLGSLAPEQPLGDAGAAVRSEPAHELRVHVVSRRATDLPDPMVRLVPARRHRPDHALDEPPVLRRERRVVVGEQRDEVHDGTEHVQLDLVRREIADAHRATAAIPGEFADLRLRAEPLAAEAVERLQTLRGRRLVDDPEHPAEELQGLTGAAESHQRRRGQRGVTQPAVAVVPVPHAAGMLRQARRRRRGDGARGTVTERLQDQRAAAHDRRVSIRRLERRRPRGPVEARLPLAFGRRRRRRVDTAGSVAQLELDRTRGEVALRGRALVRPLLHDRPGEPRRPQHDRIGARVDLEAAVDHAQARGNPAEVEPRRELDACAPTPLDPPHQVTAARAKLRAATGHVEEVHDPELRPTRLQHQRIADPELSHGVRTAGIRDAEMSGGRSAEQLAEDRRRVEPRQAQPRNPTGRRHQGRRSLIRETRVVLDRHRLRAGEPRGSQLGKVREQPRDRLRIDDAQQGLRGSLADLHAEIGSAERGEGVLVGDVVADEADRRCADALAQPLQRRALVRRQHAELDDFLAVLGDHPLERAGSVEDGSHPRVRGGVRDLAVVERNAGGLGLDARAGNLSCDLGQLREYAIAQIERLARQRLREVRIELAAVAADQVHVLGRSHHAGQVAERAAGDHRDVRMREPRQHAQCHERFAQRSRGAGIGDDRRERSVVVGGDEQDGGPGQAGEPPREVVHASSPSRNASAQACT